MSTNVGIDKASLKFLIITIGFSVLLIAGLLALIGKSSPASLETNASVEIEVLDEMTYDWGEIDINGGKVDRTFKIKNTGEGDLSLANIKTSCMCTEAQIILDGEESPMFGMHDNSKWTGTIAPGEEAGVHVVFDPLFHGPQATGPISRLVSIQTNDPDNPKVEFRLTGNVVKK